MYEWRPFRIKNVTINSPAILAPMAGITDLPFRTICAGFGAGMVCMEMVSAKALLQGNQKSFQMLDIDEGEHPVSLQLFGADPAVIGEAIRRIEEVPYDVLDINMGCPMPKITDNGEGAALLLDLKLAEKILKSAVGATDRPVSVKIRKGYHDGDNVAAEIAKMAESVGVSAITIHGRTRAQMYTGRADQAVIAEVKRAVKIPVIGNGDITTPQDALKMLENTSCDAVMAGRAVRGNPWILQAMNAFIFNHINIEKPCFDEIKAMIIKHAVLQIALYGEKLGVMEMRKHCGWYIAGQPNAAQMRDRINHASTLEEITDIIENGGK